MSESIKNQILIQSLKNSRKNNKILFSTIEKLLDNCVQAHEDLKGRVLINTTFSISELGELAKLINKTTTTKKHDYMAFLDSLTQNHAYSSNLNWIHRQKNGFLYSSNSYILAKIKDEDASRLEGLHRKNGAFINFGDKHDNKALDFDSILFNHEFTPFKFDPQTNKTYMYGKDLMYDINEQYDINGALYAKLTAFCTEKDVIKHFIANDRIVKIQVYTDNNLKYEGIIMLNKKEVK